MDDGPVAIYGQWTASSYVETSVRDVVVKILIAATGSVKVRFDLHTLCLMEYRGPELRSIVPESDEDVVFSTATLVFIPKGSIVRPTHVHPADITTIAIPDHWFEKAAGGRNLKQATFCYLDTRVDPVLLHSARMLRDLALEKEHITPIKFQDVLITSMAIRLLRMTCDVIGGDPPEYATTLSADQITLVQRFVDSNLGEQLRLTDIAAAAGLSQYHFARAFKAATGLTPMRFVLQQRIAAAKSMLAERATIAAVAIDVGFSSQSHFTTAFRRATGMTPAAWRAAISALIAGAAYYLLDLHAWLLDMLV